MNCLRNKFGSVNELIKDEFDIVLASGVKPDTSFPDS